MVDQVDIRRKNWKTFPYDCVDTVGLAEEVPSSRYQSQCYMIPILYDFIYQLFDLSAYPLNFEEFFPFEFL
jgi:hypothetical protein